MESNSIIGEVLSRDYKTRRFIANWSRNKSGFANSALNNAIKKDTVEVSKYCSDGKDDGKISTKEKIGNFAKGVIAPVTNMFSSPKNFIRGLGAIALGAGLIYITGGAAAPVMVAAGVLGGGIQIGKNALKAKNAKTDKDAKQAWQGIGTGTATVGVSVAGAKSALKASGTEAAAVSKMSPLKATVECFKKTGGYGKSILSGIKNKLTAAGTINKPDTKISAEEASVPETEITEKAADTTAKTEETVIKDEPISAKSTREAAGPKSEIKDTTADTTAKSEKIVIEDEPISAKSTEEAPIPKAEIKDTPADTVAKAEETLAQLKEAVKKQSEAVEKSGAEIDEFTQELLESTKASTDSLETTTVSAQTTTQGPKHKIHIPKIFKRKK